MMLEEESGRARRQTFSNFLIDFIEGNGGTDLVCQKYENSNKKFGFKSVWFPRVECPPLGDSSYENGLKVTPSLFFVNCL